MGTKIPQLLRKRISLFQYIKNLQALATEMFKISINMFPTVINDVLAPRATPSNLSDPVTEAVVRSCSVKKMLRLHLY